MGALVKTLLRVAFTIAVVFGALHIAFAFQGGKFRWDDPIRRDPDNLSIPQPTDRPLSKAIDLLQKTFTKPAGGRIQSDNVNTLGEVPDSSWFTNRMSRSVMTIDELVRGPDQGDGPDMSGTWTITGAKTEGITPGFTIRDASGDIYFIKFDPLNWPQMATSAEIIGTKFFHAFDYDVPENYLVYWRPEFEIDSEAEVLWDTGQVEALSEGYVRDVLKSVPRRADGTIQLVASKLLSGRPIGPFDFQGTRSDDPNDIFLHQDRRELRGLRVFAASLNHNDSDSVNTLDMYYSDPDGSNYVRHHLIDFGTTLGSGAVQPHARRVGNEYYIEFKPALKAALTLGIWDRPWRHLDYPVYTSIGRFESSYFQPDEWKPDYPNPAFDKMTFQDALWATRTVMRFSDEAIRAIVATGEIEDPEAEAYLSQTLMERRDKIVDFYLAEINPIDGFTVDGGGLDFVNLGVDAGMASECRYDYSWNEYDNESGAVMPTDEKGTVSTTTIPVPSGQAPFAMVRIQSNCEGRPKWSSPIDVYLRNGDSLSVVGVERADPD